MAKITFILIAIFLFVFALIVIFCVCIVAGSLREDFEENMETENSTVVCKKQLCPMCKTGKKSYDIDKLSETCPYIQYLKNGKCKFFELLD